jgi:hypothetical protein
MDKRAETTRVMETDVTRFLLMSLLILSSCSHLPQAILQVGRWHVRFPMNPLDFTIGLIPPVALRPRD